jgi:hypothetical protein
MYTLLRSPIEPILLLLYKVVLLKLQRKSRFLYFHLRHMAESDYQCVKQMIGLNSEDHHWVS